MFGVGMIVGAVVGASIAVLVVPRSGPETRQQIGRRLGKLRSGRGTWGKLGRELRRAAAVKRKQTLIEAKRREIALRAAAGT
jgi:gas vesicle protein